MSYTLGIIGGGNMGQAIVRGGIAAGVVAPAQIIIAEIDPEKRRALTALNCTVTSDACQASLAEQIILALKPQVFPEVSRLVAPLGESKVVITIMAGLHTSAIRAALGTNARMIRVMPNVACQIGAGMSAVARGDGAESGDEALALSLFGALGKTVLLDESHMHAVTAVSGSGPAYIFALAEAMEAAGSNLGLDPAVARLLVAQTVYGAGKLLNKSEQSAAALRQAVTSPGGTTAAALKVFDERQFQSIVIDALKAARDRGEELEGR